MKKEGGPNESSQDIFSTWVKSAGDFWGSMLQAWSHMGSYLNTPEKPEQSKTESSKRATLDAAQKSFQLLSKLLVSPNVMESLLKGTEAMPEIMFKLEQSSFSSFLQLQQKWLERASRLGKSTEAFKFEDLDENAFRAWTDVYEKEFQQFFNIPQLGLTRFHQEKVNRAIDKYTIFQSTFGEFLRLLYLPISHSLTAMQDKMGELVEKEELPADAKIYYQMWIKILEGHYMTLFQSPEYVQALGKTLQGMSEFFMARNEVLEDMLSSMPIPKQKDLDDLYHELYILKKRIKTLEKKQ